MTERAKWTRRRYLTGDKELDTNIEQLVEASGISNDSDLVAEMITACFRVARDRSDRGEMKLVYASLKEFAYAFKVFKQYRGVRKVSIFGSSRSHPEDPNYQCARLFAKEIAERGWMVITGAGPGIMEAGHEGAGAERSFGANIRLPMDVEPNVIIEGDPKLINFKYFFTRKVQFVKESDAFALFPGGYGTLDEAFELLTLIQTGKSDIHPIVMVEAEGTGYWSAWEQMVDTLLREGMISEPDFNLYKVTTDIDEAVEELIRFYRVYHSQRFVDNLLVLRLSRDVPESLLDDLTTEFSDIIRTGRNESIPPTHAEMDTEDHLDLARIAFDFDRHGFGCLLALIDRLNDSAN